MDGGASRGPHCLAIGLLYMYVHVHTCIFYLMVFKIKWTSHARTCDCTHVRARTRSQTVLANTRKRTQMQTHTNKRTQTIAAISAWPISACKRDCVLRIGSKTFRMYYSCCAHSECHGSAGATSEECHHDLYTAYHPGI